MHARGAEAHTDATHVISCVGPDLLLAFRVHQDCPRAALVHEAGSVVVDAQGPLASIQDRVPCGLAGARVFGGDADVQDEEQRFCVLLMVDRGDSDANIGELLRGLRRVREACRFPEPHVTLAEGSGGKGGRADQTTVGGPALSRIQYGPPKPWDRCLALGLDDATPLYDLACDLEMPSTVKLKNSSIAFPI